jgi:two-component system, response regulator FlrC
VRGLIPKRSAAAVPEVADALSDLDGDLQRREFEIILDTLRQTGGSKKTAAERLGISPRTLRYKLARMRGEGVDVE